MDETTEVLAADDQFFAALAAMFLGDLGPMRAAWSHADDVVYMGPDRRLLVGWSAVLPDWEKQAAMKMGGQIEVRERHVTLGTDLAVVHHLARGSNTSPDGQPVEVSTRGTNVFRRESGAWKLIAHHSDPLAFLES